MDWKNFELPSSEILKSVISVSSLSGVLADVTNFFIHVSSEEPKAKERLDSIRLEISSIEKRIDLDLQKDLAQYIEIMPDVHKKNINLQTGWVRNKLNDKYGKFEAELIVLRKKMLEAQAVYDVVYRKIQTGRVVLDVGRSILSGLKEELRNLDNV